MTDGYENVVVGYDGSDEGSDALALARILAGDDGRLIAACVAPLPHFHSGHFELRAQLEAQAARHTGRLGRRRGHSRRGGAIGCTGAV